MSSVFCWYPNARKPSRMNISASPTDSSYHIMFFTTWTDFSSIFKDFKYSSFTECKHYLTPFLSFFQSSIDLTQSESKLCLLRQSTLSIKWSSIFDNVVCMVANNSVHYVCVLTVLRLSDYCLYYDVFLSLVLVLVFSVSLLFFSISCDHIPFLDLMTFFSSDDLVMYLYSSRQRRLSSNLIWSLLHLLLAKIYESSSLLLLWPVGSCRTHSRD